MSARISVVIPTFNLEAYASRTLASVLAQTSLPDDIVVVDDGSTDGTVELLRAAFRTSGADRAGRLLPGPHLGPGACRNRGIREALGDWVAFLDGDDLWLPGKIAALRTAIASHPEASIIAHDEFAVGLDGSQKLFRLHEHFDPSRPLLPQLYRGCFLTTSAVAVRTEALKAAGGFDETLPSGQDYDLWLRLARDCRLHCIPEPLTRYIIRPGSISADVLTRYSCLRRIAFRHAGSVAAVAGGIATRMLRLRLIAAAQKSMLLGLAGASRYATAAGAVPRLTMDLAAAVLAPVDEGGSCALLS